MINEEPHAFAPSTLPSQRSPGVARYVASPVRLSYSDAITDEPSPCEAVSALVPRERRSRTGRARPVATAVVELAGADRRSAALRSTARPRGSPALRAALAPARSAARPLTSYRFSAFALRCARARCTRAPSAAAWPGSRARRVCGRPGGSWRREDSAIASSVGAELQVVAPFASPDRSRTGSPSADGPVGCVFASAKMCSPAQQAARGEFGRAVRANTWKHSANAAASRPARFGLTGEPGGPARNTGRWRM